MPAVSIFEVIRQIINVTSRAHQQMRVMMAVLREEKGEEDKRVAIFFAADKIIITRSSGSYPLPLLTLSGSEQKWN